MTAETDRYMDEQVQRRLALLWVEMAEGLVERARAEHEAAQDRLDSFERDLRRAQRKLAEIDRIRTERMQAKGLPVDQ